MVVPLLPKPCNQNPDRQVYPVFDLAEIRNYFDPSVTFFTLMFLISLFFLPTRVKRAILHVTVEEKPQLFFVPLCPAAPHVLLGFKMREEELLGGAGSWVMEC